MAVDLTKLVGFNFSGLEVSSVDIDTAADDPSNPSLNYVPGSTTYNVVASGFVGNNADNGIVVDNVFEQVTAASNGTNIDGSALHPGAIGQIVYNDVVNGAASPSSTYDVLGVSADGSSLLVAPASSYGSGPATDPYGLYNIISDMNIDGNATPSLFPGGTQTFKTTNTYIGGPSTFANGRPTTGGGVAADLVSVTNALAGVTIPANLIVSTTSSTGVTANADGSYTVHQTGLVLATGSGTFSAVAGGVGAEGQSTLKYAAVGGTSYFQVVGFNGNQILLESVASNGNPLGQPRFYILSQANAPAQTANVNITFNDFGLAPNVFCFLTGTRIATPSGEREIETLKTGDLVLTAEGSALPVRWLGRSTVATLFADPLRIMPIRIAAGALGEALPSRDLLLSPDHAVFVDGVLVQAGALVNGTTIRRQTDMPTVFTYYHLELDGHHLVLAEGAPAESFVDNVDRMGFDNWDEHPALDAAEMTELPYARAKSARQVPLAVRRIVAARAQILLGGVPAAA